MGAITGLDKQHAMRMLAFDRSIGRAAVSVGCVLIDRCNLKTQLCYPSIELIAAETMYDVRTVKRALRELKRTGWISSTRRGRNNFYIINWERPEDLKRRHHRRIADFKALRETRGKGDSDVTLQEGASEAPKSRSERPDHFRNDPPHSSEIEKGDNFVPLGDRSDTPTSVNPANSLGDEFDTLTLEGKPRNINQKTGNRVGPPSAAAALVETENVSKSPSTRAPSVSATNKMLGNNGAEANGEPSNQTVDRVTAIRACKRDLERLGYSDAEHLVHNLPTNVAIAATSAEIHKYGFGVGATLIIEYLKTGKFNG